MLLNLLEPDEWKQSCPVLRGGRGSKKPSTVLPDKKDAAVTPEPTPSSTNGLLRLAIALGFISYGIILAVHYIADGDLWGKLAIGAHVWKYGRVPEHDMFAFTPVLPSYVEHEWGAGTIFFGVIKFFGPAGLMVLKIILACGALWAAIATGRRIGVTWETLLVLAIPATACVLPAYIPCVRSHAFTYCFFALTLLGLEEIRAGKRWPVFTLPALMLVWSNVHGGFMAGLGAMAVYLAFALVTRREVKLTLVAVVGSGAATLLNIYGLKFWSYLIPALLNNRPHIAEWRPLPLFASDIYDGFTGFRILFGLVVLVLLAAWRYTKIKSWPGLAMLAITAVLAWHSRRHTPFFGVTALAFVGPFFHTLLAGLAAWLPPRLRATFSPALVALVVQGGIALYVFVNFLPRVSFQILAPVGHDPVREADILSLAKAEGNLATPFEWGGYCSWRLYPRIKISMDGRYETTFPESTFELNFNFFEKRGPDWDRLIRDYQVDYVILAFAREHLRPEDLLGRGYAVIWLNPGHSALMALQKHADSLRRVAAELPPETIDPVDSKIPDHWWPH